MKKKILLILVTVLVVGGIVGIGVSSHIDKVRREREAEHIVEKHAREELTKYLVKNYDVGEEVKEVDFTPFDKPTAFGGGGYTTAVRINKSEKLTCVITPDSLKKPVVDNSVFSISYDDVFKKRSKPLTDVDISNIKIGKWNGK